MTRQIEMIYEEAGGIRKHAKFILRSLQWYFEHASTLEEFEEDCETLYYSDCLFEYETFLKLKELVKTNSARTFFNSPASKAGDPENEAQEKSYNCEDAHSETHLFNADSAVRTHQEASLGHAKTINNQANKERNKKVKFQLWPIEGKAQIAGPRKILTLTEEMLDRVEEYSGKCLWDLENWVKDCRRGIAEEDVFCGEEYNQAFDFEIYFLDEAGAALAECASLRAV